MAAYEVDNNSGASGYSEPTGNRVGVGRNIIANLTGKVWTAVLGLAFVPVYIRLLGMEAYGLVGFYATLQAIFTLLDMGLSTTLNRELARRSVEENGAQGMRDMTRTLEAIYWLLAVLIACIVLGLSTVVADHWINAKQLPPQTLHMAVAGMGLALALQFPFALYQGGLLGLQRQVQLNVILIIMATLRFAGVVLVLLFVSRTIVAYFAWQIVVSGLQSLIFGLFLWKSLPKAKAPKFNWTLLSGVWKFAAGMAGISMLAVLLTQIDKLVLSKLLPLEMFGYYVLAGTVAGSLSVIVAPFFMAVFPRFSQLVAAGDELVLKELYHRACQVLAVVLLPTAAVIAFFAPELLQLWTGDPVIARNTHLLASILVIGTALNGLMNVPYALQLAHGWTKLSLYLNTAAAIILAPMVALMARSYGAPAAASVWVVLNSVYIIIGIQLMHRRLLKGEKTRWYFQDSGLPMITAVAVAGFGRMVVPRHASPHITLALVLGVLVVAIIAASLATPAVRSSILPRLWMPRRAI